MADERGKMRILFMCTHNSCRSQMAEGWARRLKGDIIEPFSAGVREGEIDPLAVRVMAEAGVDISAQRSRHVDEVRHLEFDAVVTVCDPAREACPVLPGAPRMVHVAFDNPPALARDAASEEEALGHYRRVRDEIRAFVEGLSGSLDAGEP